MLAKFKRIRDAYTAFIHGKGFALIATLCVAVITGAAVWTQGQEEPYTAPTPPVSEDQSVAVQLQESLRSMTSPTPLPSASAVLYQAPLDVLNVLTDYTDDAFTKSGETGVWSVHTGADLKAETGDPVRSMADGIVSDLSQDDISGVWVEITHSDGIRTRYAGMSMLAALKVNDRVRAGQTIGYAGVGPVGEGDLGPHLHLEAYKDDQTIDPLLLID